MSRHSGRGGWSPTPATVVAMASLGAASVTSGIQGIAPAIPAMQAEFSLTPAQVALITSTYLLPSIFSAFAAGLLADRIGARSVFSGSLLMFGAGGAVLLVEHSFPVLMLLRVAQGAAFGAVLALSVSIIGSVTPTRVDAARGQSRRIISMAVAEAAFPVIGGLLLGVSWYAPFAMQLLAIPIALGCWVTLPPLTSRRGLGVRGTSRAVLTAPAIVGVQVLGALRFIFKFAVLTYFPVLAIDEVGLTPSVVGGALGAMALLAAVAAASTERLARHWSSAQLIAGCLTVTAACVLGMAVGGNAAVVVCALLLFGVQDGVYGVAHNVLVTELAPADARSTYVGLTGTVRNIGKFVAPLAFGATTLALTVPQSFLALAGLGVASLGVAKRVARAEPPESASGGSA